MATQAALNLLQSSTCSVHPPRQDSRIVDKQVKHIKSTIDTIFAIIEDKSWSRHTLEVHLWDLSSFFREEKFSTVVLPVLDAIAKRDIDAWKTAKQWDTQMPLIPKSFENMKASTIEVMDQYGVILSPSERERELALLSVYGITLEVIWQAFRILDRKSQQ